MILCLRGESHYFQEYKQGSVGLISFVKEGLYFQGHYISTIKGYHDISTTHADGQRFTDLGTSSLHEHITVEANLFLV